jgi:hypothetical protein
MSDTHLSTYLPDNVSTNDTSEQNDDNNVVVRKSSRIRSKPNILTMEKGGIWSDKNLAFIEDYVLNTIVDSSYTPNTYKDAISCNDSAMWIDSMQNEYDTLVKMDTFHIVDRPINANVLPCKWIYKLKDNGIYKSRLVPLGCNEIHGIDYS